MRPKFVLFGSSIVQYNHYGEGWGATLAHLYGRKVDIVLRGYAGWNSRRGLQIVDHIFPKNTTESEQPALAIVYFGGNDSHLPHHLGIGPHVPLKDYIENMRKIASHLKKHAPKTRLIFLSCPPISETQIKEGNIDEFGKAIRTNEVRQEYSKALLKLCSDMNIKAIDMWSLIQREKDWKEVCFIDGIHFSAVGSKLVSKEIIKFIKEADWVPSLYWKEMPVEFGEDSPYDPIHPNGMETINISNIPFPPDEDWEWV